MTRSAAENRKRALPRLKTFGTPVRLVVLALALTLLVLIAPACSSLVSDAQEAEAAGDLESATQLYRARLQEEPEDLTALRGLAVALSFQGNFNEALPVQERIVSLDEGDAETRIELGFNYLNHQGQPAKAVATFTEATEVEPSAKYLTFLAQAQLEAGNSPEAEAALRKALSEDESYGHAYTVLTALLEAEGRTTEAEGLRAAASAKGVVTEVSDGR